MRPIIIGVGGAHSGSGKTTYASLLLNLLKGWGAIKFTKTNLYSSLVDDYDLLSREDKDTKRFLDSGSAKVLWVKAPAGELGAVLPLALEKLWDLPGIIVEGNSAIEFLKPDIIIFIFGTDPEKIKESARPILEMADIIVSDRYEAESKSRPVKRFGRSASDYDTLLQYVADIVDKKEKIRSLLLESSVDGTLPCAVARKIAEELAAPYDEIGKTANELKIKIKNCELGCF